jgi:signal transduction histidine kinase
MHTKSVHILQRLSTVRILAAAWAGSLLLAWALLAAGWSVAKARLAAMADDVATATRSLSEARHLESEILAHQREYLLWEATGRADYRDRSRQHLQSAERVAADLAPHTTSAEEHALSTEIQGRLRSVREQWPLAPPTPQEAEAAGEIRWVDDLLTIMDQYRAINESQLEESIQAAKQVRTAVSQWVLGLLAGTAALLFGGAWAFLRRIIHPVLNVTRAAEAFGQGGFSVRAPVAHDDELGALARTFNNMAGDIADREKDRLQFVAMVVHDLKNPVLAIDMATRVLGRSHAAEEERRSYLDAIREEVTRLRGIIRDLTDDIQVVNGRFSVRKTEVDLGMLIRQFVQARRNTFATHEILAETDEDCTVQADADRISRVLMNLVSNAVKYSPRGTRITLRVHQSDSQAMLTVSDQGSGIAKEDLQVLFQPFGRGRSAHTLAEGTGIGLYVVKQIIEAHDGRIEVHSAPGSGATFEIRLPLAKEKSSREAVRSQAAALKP